jgi:hypothetical protein
LRLKKDLGLGKVSQFPGGFAATGAALSTAQVLKQAL